MSMSEIFCILTYSKVMVSLPVKVQTRGQLSKREVMMEDKEALSNHSQSMSSKGHRYHLLFKLTKIEGLRLLKVEEYKEKEILL